MGRPKAVMILLFAHDALVPLERRDHALRRSLARYRKFRIGGDFLLISRIDDTDGSGGSVYFAGAATHTDLFE